MSDKKIIDDLDDALADRATRTVLFFREGFFYPVELTPKCSVEEHARLNPGTLKVEDAATGDVLWSVDRKPN